MKLGLPPSRSLRTASPVDLRTPTLKNALPFSSSGSTCPSNKIQQKLWFTGRSWQKKGYLELLSVVSELAPSRELLQLGMHSSLPPCSLKWWACHSLSFYWNYRTSKETEACFFKLSFAEARLHRRDALTGNTLCLSRQPIFHGAHLHTIYYWTLLEHKAISLCNENSSYKGIYASVMGFFPQHFYISLPASPFHTSCSRTTRWPWCLQCWMW